MGKRIAIFALDMTKTMNDKSHQENTNAVLQTANAEGVGFDFEKHVI